MRGKILGIISLIVTEDCENGRSYRFDVHNGKKKTVFEDRK
jgi:hypothetical protein